MAQCSNTMISLKIKKLIFSLYFFKNWASLIAQLVKNHLRYRKPWLDSWVGKICWRRDRPPTPVVLGFLCGSAGKESASNAGDLDSIPGLGRSPGEGKATHSSILAWRISRTVQSVGLQRVGHDRATFTSFKTSVHLYLYMVPIKVHI